jgi:hypothetical protein
MNKNLKPTINNIEHRTWNMMQSLSLHCFATFGTMMHSSNSAMLNCGKCSTSDATPRAAFGIRVQLELATAGSIICCLLWMSALLHTQ